jgi:hypothetical protein
MDQNAYYDPEILIPPSRKKATMRNGAKKEEKVDDARSPVIFRTVDYYVGLSFLIVKSFIGALALFLID